MGLWITFMDDAVSIGIYRAFLENECSVHQPKGTCDIPFYFGCCLGEREGEEVGSQRWKSFRSLVTVESDLKQKLTWKRFQKAILSKVLNTEVCVCFLVGAQFNAFLCGDEKKHWLVMRLREDEKCQLAEGKREIKGQCFKLGKKTPHILKIKNPRDCQPPGIRLGR